MTYEQVEYIAERVAEICKKRRGKIIVDVIPPQTATSGLFNFMFTVHEEEVMTGEDDSVMVRIAR